MAEIVVNTLGGESVVEAVLLEWLKKPGDSVAADEDIATLETEKVNMEVKAPAAGILEEILIQPGGTVTVGAVLGRIAENGAAGAAKPAPAAAAAPALKAEPAPAPAAPAPAAPAPAEGGGMVEITIATLGGESIAEAVLRWSKKPGDAVAQDEAVASLEAEKADLEVVAPAAGTLAEVLVQTDATVTPGTVIGRIRTGAAASPAAAAPASAAPSAPATATAPVAAAAGQAETRNGPAVTKLLAESGADVARIQGSGKDGRLTKGDVLSHLAAPPQALKPAAPAAAAATPAPAVAKAPSGPRPRADREERVRMTGLRRTIAARLKEAQNTAAMLTTFNEVDMKPVMDLRNEYKDVFEKKHGQRLGFMGFFIKAAVQALKDYPAVNAEIDGTDMIYKNYYDIAVAVSTPQGLVVPVVRDCDQKSIAEIEAAIADLAKRGRDGKLTVAEMKDGSFSITNGGVFGSMLSTPILNAPQSAILGMHATKERPVVVNGQIVIRPIMYLALSYDHRIIDGREAVSALVRIKEVIEDPRRLILGL